MSKNFLIAVGLISSLFVPSIAVFAAGENKEVKIIYKSQEEIEKDLQALKEKENLKMRIEESKKEEAITTPSGLKYVDKVVGTGNSPKKSQRVTVHYTGWLENGTKFDSSVDRGQPFDFVIGVGQVIKGWDEGVSTMKVGGKRKLIISPSLGYGAQGAGNTIPPNSTLLFDVELLGIK